MTEREKFEKWFFENGFLKSATIGEKMLMLQVWEAAKAQAVPCPNVNEAINNPMPRGYMLNMLVKFQKWRIGEDVRTLDETGLTPRLITLAIDWAIEQLDKSKSQAVPEQQK